MLFDDLSDRTVLTTREYATPERLNARIALYEYQEPRHDLVGSAVRLLHQAPGPVLDVGCGPGHYRAALRVDRSDRATIACDLSMGMLMAAGAPALVADAAALPVREASCGAVLATHMLYHVPDPEAGVAELARVRAPGGTVLLATNGARDKRRVRDVHDEVMRELTGRPDATCPAGSPSRTANGWPGATSARSSGSTSTARSPCPGPSRSCAGSAP